MADSGRQLRNRKVEPGRTPESRSFISGPAVSGSEQQETPARTRNYAEGGLPKSHKVLILFLASFLPAVYLFSTLDIDAADKRFILGNLAFSSVGFLLTVWLIPVAVPYMLRKGMFGMDINKRGSPGGDIKVPESQGLVAGIVFLVCTIIFQHFYFSADSPWLVEYNAALASICFMIFLGFIDDVLDIPWRVKLLLPTVAALPLLMAYAGGTSIVVPKPLRWLFKPYAGGDHFEIGPYAVPVPEALRPYLAPYLSSYVIELGWLYKLYMGLLAVFCTNSINIHAGVNGLEAGQTVIIAASILTYNISVLGGIGVGWPLAAEKREAQLFCLYLMQPFLAVTMGVLSYNWYPSTVFVGDTFTYFAGMTFAVVGILGHFSEMLLLFFIPQILNFLYSCPQLFKIVPCPRHRLPKFDPETGLLTGSNDLNLVNLFLRIFGPLTEQQLCIRLLVFQGFCSVAAFTIRHLLTGVYK
ncbi:UDP-N-acetylglucosamine--dolichyl-phosphate N-acetylglucosaminephosphotransferase [Klebsormidium nitens]|uniref:UDP-N-acetylglucosamine--dolichyl-phosphate N-acetylglucosaminephosphotransferase n=1 Tax=Klebsormidium nitens TaxID=105231 RepID=A0A1Y1HXT2_KLENI|nr:UDP-N-acetylglucosamine--dolichyl-phosphate N-acetylglucosaminephosphotransferase [Klebsormidium nitens]|eukprot:GAQ80668.1 UDP-N-acetylglucosamine--dolichyl-phosphate N-acetylglucosaminephosphotransferase [Klebsormidium nitens]